LRLDTVGSFYRRLRGADGRVLCARAFSINSALRPLRETPPIGRKGDAADDPTIWVGPRPGDSRIIATQKFKFVSWAGVEGAVRLSQ
jgi:myo-inositol-hexaphosphate 3-phosphohydrolase